VAKLLISRLIRLEEILALLFYRSSQPFNTMESLVMPNEESIVHISFVWGGQLYIFQRRVNEIFLVLFDWMTSQRITRTLWEELVNIVRSRLDVLGVQYELK
jgi:hypothetical protein